MTYTVNYISGALVKADDFSTIVRNVSLNSFSVVTTVKMVLFISNWPHLVPLCQLSVFKYDLTIPAKQKVAIPYQFHSEFAPQDLGLTVIIDFSDSVSLDFGTTRVWCHPNAGHGEQRNLIIRAIL